MVEECALPGEGEGPRLERQVRALVAALPARRRRTRPGLLAAAALLAVALPVVVWDARPTPLQSAPLQSAPLQSAPLQSAPLQSAPLQTAPQHTAALHTAALHTAPLHAATVALQCVRGTPEPARGAVRRLEPQPVLTWTRPGERP